MTAYELRRHLEHVHDVATRGLAYEQMDELHDYDHRPGIPHDHDHENEP